MGVSFLFGLIGGGKKLLTSKTFWLSIAAVGVLGAAYMQHRSIVNLELDNQKLEITEQRLLIQVAEGDAARAKLLEDVQRMNDINQRLEEGKMQAYARIEAQREELSEVIMQLDTLKTPEQVETARQRVRTIMVTSYGCLEAATGKVGALCE